MPGKSSIMLILAFFMTMATLQYARNYGNRLDEAPPLKPSLELAAEDGPTEWFLFANGQKLGHAVSQVVKTQSGVYTLRQAVILDGDIEAYLGPLAQIAKRYGVQLNDYTAGLRTNMELTYLGTMKNLHVEFKANPRPKLLPGQTLKNNAEDELKITVDKTSVISLRLDGKTGDGFLTFKGVMELAGMKIPIDEQKVKYRNKDTYLSNIAPTDCLAGLRPGQRWQTPVIDPMSMMFGAFASSKAKDFTDKFDPDEIINKKLTEVVVLEELKILEWQGRKIPCCVVQTSDKRMRLQVWVDVATSRVLRQNIEWLNKSIELVRQPKKDD